MQEGSGENWCLDVVDTDVFKASRVVERLGRADVCTKSVLEQVVGDFSRAFDPWRFTSCVA